MATVIAFIVKEDGAYGVMFPDFPGAVTGGDTLDEALRRARATLEAHVEALIEEGIALPELRSLDAITADDSLADLRGEADLVAAIEVDLPGKSVRVNVSFDERLLERIDRAAAAVGESRSGFLAAAAKRRIAESGSAAA
ncbi:type II toxin-antitoxin system HicB family antitoxin [Chelatococcus asaccharovorans]|uniref:type II toxin-antitoxin system HicB family antitoxin n=1 Tax=Chelatococcus asaccharovorans TaxID=28210 RepID=UPI00224C6A95|nr:type II toxin-antitoxin system HicB family antitoxin [Chelatococcus asaccharovorans]CAH1671959.1 Predicted nuclease of the RNAse H fold, HicB family [Chelatococcus asaccharovorans]CAH1676635.1 Predicted nuclease of the RNAse H fold, HicB family [Chelatococcus asaccharovorans]